MIPERLKDSNGWSCTVKSPSSPLTGTVLVNAVAGALVSGAGIPEMWLFPQDGPRRGAGISDARNSYPPTHTHTQPM
jgi:hypothetical protein